MAQARRARNEPDHFVLDVVENAFFEPADMVAFEREQTQAKNPSDCFAGQISDTEIVEKRSGTPNFVVHPSKQMTPTLAHQYDE